MSNTANKTMQNEPKIKREFRPIKDYPGYLISNYGEVYSSKSDKILTQYIDNIGYYRTQIINENGKIKKRIHRLVAGAFCEPASKNHIHVDHKDGNKLNNMAINLRWATPSENAKNAHRNNSNLSQGRAVLKYSKTGKYLRKYRSIRSAAKAVGLKSHKEIIKCCNDKTNRKTSRGFKWKYIEEKKKHKVELKDNEKFKKLIEFEGYEFKLYEVSNYGTVKNFTKGEILRSTNESYKRISLQTTNYGEITFEIHRLVAYLFVPENRDVELFVNHKDKKKHNNYAGNLEWLSHTDNVIHSCGQPVCGIDFDTGNIIYFKAISTAAKYVGLKSYYKISDCCKCDAPSAGNHFWFSIDKIPKNFKEGKYYPFMDIYDDEDAPATEYTIPTNDKKQIAAINMLTGKIIYFESLSAANRYVDAKSHSLISKCCNSGGSKSYLDHVYEFFDKPEGLEYEVYYPCIE